MSEKGLSPIRPNSRSARTLSRRQFMKLTFAGVAGAALASSCETAASRRMPAPFTVGIPATPVPHELSYPAVPLPPAVPPDPNVLYFFTEHQAATVDAFASRLLPGSPEDPGAHEAGVVNYIDYMLSRNEGFHEPVYRLGPYPELYEGDEPPPEAAETDPEVIWVADDEIERYGYQSPLSPAEVYRIGLEALDEYTQEQHGSDFVDLSEDQQDAIITAMVEGEDLGFEPFTAQQFFHVIRRHTNEGFFSDPAYGGNRNMVGWRLIRWPGSQRTYAPAEIAQEGIEREPWSLADLPPFYYARPRTTLPAAPARGPHPGLEDEREPRGRSH
jgi:gluconate 2-dehydrogenase gamma chain